MSDMYISSQLRRAVKERAEGVCEYCGVSDDVTLAPHEPDHINGEQHGGATELENLAYACFRSKGPNIATVDPQAGVLVPLYHPRSDLWHDHFNFIPDSALIEPLTAIGRGAASLLRFNDEQRIALRLELLRQGRYKTPQS
jgi:hypothetical protein